MAKLLSDEAVRRLERVMKRVSQLPHNTRMLPVEGPSFDPPGVVYVAYAPYGIPGRSGTELGSAECTVFQVVRSFKRGTGSGSGSGSHFREIYELIEIFEKVAVVCNVDEVPINPGWVVVVRESGGSWIAVVSSGSAGRVLVRINGAVGVQTPIGTGCIGTGSGSGTDGADECGMVFHGAEVIQADARCQDYLGIGDCVWATELRGRRLVPNRLYWADILEPAPPVLRGQLLDPNDPGCIPADGATVVSIDIGQDAETLFVGERLGKLCVGSGSSSGITDAEFGKDSNLVLYLASWVVWDEQLCIYTAVSRALVANAEGCELDEDSPVTGVFHTMVNRSQLPSIDPDRCLPLYITTERAYVAPVGDIKCEGGVLKVYSLEKKQGLKCGYELTFWHSAGCCDCGGGTGSSSGGMCGAAASPDQYTFDLTLGNGSCLDCTSVNGTHTLTSDGGNCWTEDVTTFCVFACTAFTLCCVGDNMELFLCGAIYTAPISGWNWLGSNEMTFDSFVGTPTACTWPPTITVNAVM